MNEQEFFHSVETGLVVSSLSFWELRKKTSLKIALRSFYAKYLYILRLYKLREYAIIIALLNNYDKIPSHTPTKVFISLVKTLRALRTFVYAREKKLRHLITNYS